MFYIQRVIEVVSEVIAKFFALVGHDDFRDAEHICPFENGIGHRLSRLIGDGGEAAEPGEGVRVDEHELVAAGGSLKRPE